MDTILKQLAGRERTYSDVTIYTIVRDLLPEDWTLVFQPPAQDYQVMSAHAYADSIYNQIADLANTVNYQLVINDETRVVILMVKPHDPMPDDWQGYTFLPDTPPAQD